MRKYEMQIIKWRIIWPSLSYLSAVAFFSFIFLISTEGNSQLSEAGFQFQAGNKLILKFLSNWRDILFCMKVKLRVNMNQFIRC